MSSNDDSIWVCKRTEPGVVCVRWVRFIKGHLPAIADGVFVARDCDGCRERRCSPANSVVSASIIAVNEIAQLRPLHPGAARVLPAIYFMHRGNNNL